MSEAVLFMIDVLLFVTFTCGAIMAVVLTAAFVFFSAKEFQRMRRD